MWRELLFFKLMELERIDVMLIQETHSDLSNESDLKMWCSGNIILSHKSSCSGGVGIMFSRSFLPASCEVQEIIKGAPSKVRVQYEKVNMVFINVYAPPNGIERMSILSVLCNTIRECKYEYLFLGGDFNCTENPVLDRNHLKPHSAYSCRFRKIKQEHELSDVWRNFHGNIRHSHGHSHGNQISLARLDHLYCTLDITQTFLEAAILIQWVFLIIVLFLPLLL